VAEDAKTVPGTPTVGDTPVGTIQMRPGEQVEHAPPVMPTLPGGATPIGAPPAMPNARYEMGDEIARGGMGRVVEATDTMLGRTVALKEVLSLDPDVLRRFAREVRITARLEHPSIVPVHDAGSSSGGAPYYVMRKISGRPLERLVATAETLNQRLVLIPHIVAAAQAIAHAHARGIVHRDIKPSNILVGDLGETIVIDWGLAKVIGEADEPYGGSGAADDDAIKTRAGIVFGTPGFMAPEQLRGYPVDERCDVYALGATLYHLLSRKPPHYAKTADEMMKAAARESPPSIVELVPGVPPELSTIVDKALAHDPKARYQDARAVAEDLQRFLSGQLVASHRYSPRERVLRFVRQNRVPVMIAAAAALLLLIGGAIMVIRVIGERDRADDARAVAVAEKKLAEEERARAEQRADELTLTQARSEVEINPTRAIAMIKPLAQKHWREARSIAVAARASGVAYSLPASAKTATLQMSRDGQRALGAGVDGVIRRYDFAKRTAQVVAELGQPVRARYADEERRIVAWNDTRLVVIDAASKQRTEVTTPTKIYDLEVVGVTAYWTDVDRTLWQLDLAGTAPVAIPLDEHVEQLEPSPDGRWIALIGEYHLMLFDRTQPAAPPLEVITGRTKDLDWSDDGARLAALVDYNALDIAVDAVSTIRQKLNVGMRRFVAYGNNRVYTIGATGVSVVSRNDVESGPRKQLVGDPIGLREARGGTMVAGSTGGIAVLSEYGDHPLAAPFGHIDIIEASARSPWVLATVEGELFVWNLDDIEPRRLAPETPGMARFVGSDHLIAGATEPTWIDIPSGKARSLGPWGLHSVAAAPSGQLACAIDIGHRARLVGPTGEQRELHGVVDVAGFASEHQLLLGQADAGTVELFDVRTNQRAQLIKANGKLLDIAWNRASPAWVAAAFGDGTVWRRNLGTGAQAVAPGHITPTSHLHVIADGSVLFAEGRAIRIWRPGGQVDTQADLPKPPSTIGLAGPDHLIAFVGGGIMYVVELGAPNRVHESAETVRPVSATLDADEALSVSMSLDTGLITVPVRGGIEIIDPVLAHRWTLAPAPPQPANDDRRTVTYIDPVISTDGKRVVAQLPMAGLMAWTIAVPPTPEDSAVWVRALTNGTIDPKTGKLVWR
jgi:hypothetical protein